MGLKDSLKNLFLIDEDDFDEIEEVAEAEKPKKDKSIVSRKTVDEPAAKTDFKSNARPQRTTAFSVTNPNAFKMLLIEPKSVDECRMLVDSLKGRRPVIVNLEKIETETARKIFDFLSGAVYALNGNVQKVSNNIFIFAPENVDISDNSAKNSSGFNFSSDKNSWR